jgi:hypothetical protein
MKKEASKKLNRKQRAELKALSVLSEEKIDVSDAPELLDWSGAKRGLFHQAENTSTAPTPTSS